MSTATDPNTNVARWLDSLDPLAARTLRAASVFGTVFFRGGVCALEPLVPPSVVDAWLMEFWRNGALLRRNGSRFEGEDTWLFKDPTLADAVVQTLGPAERAAGHSRAARWFQAAGELDVAVIAAHLIEGENPPEAAPWCIEAARVALCESRYDDALAWTDEALRARVDPVTEGGLRLLELGIHDARGDLDAAERCGQEAWRVAPHGSMEWFRAASALAVLAMRRLKPELFRELAPALEEALRNPGTGLAAAGLALAVPPMLVSGQYALAELVIDRLEAILASGEHPEPTFPARVYAARAARASFDEDFTAYVEESRRAARVYEAADDARFALLNWGNVGYGQLCLGDIEGATSTLRWVIEQAHARDLRRIVAHAQHNLALARLFAGNVEEAHALVTEALATAVALSDHQVAAGARLYLARVRLEMGDPAGAHEAARQALAGLSGAPSSRVLGLAICAEASRLLGDVAGALDATEEALHLLTALGSVEEGEGLLRLARAEALLAAGDMPRACEALREARERLEARSARITPDAARVRFLYDIPEHARTLELVERWLGGG